MKRKTQKEMKKSAELKQNIAMEQLRRTLPAMNMGDGPVTDTLGSYTGTGRDDLEPVQDQDDL